MLHLGSTRVSLIEASRKQGGRLRVSVVTAIRLVYSGVWCNGGSARVAEKAVFHLHDHKDIISRKLSTLTQ